MDDVPNQTRKTWCICCACNPPSHFYTRNGYSSYPHSESGDESLNDRGYQLLNTPSHPSWHHHQARERQSGHWANNTGDDASYTSFVHWQQTGWPVAWRLLKMKDRLPMLGNSSVNRSEAIRLRSKYCGIIWSNGYDGLSRCIFVCSRRSNGRMLVENALMASDNDPCEDQDTSSQERSPTTSPLVWQKEVIHHQIVDQSDFGEGHRTKKTSEHAVFVMKINQQWATLKRFEDQSHHDWGTRRTSSAGWSLSAFCKACRSVPRKNAVQKPSSLCVMYWLNFVAIWVASLSSSIALKQDNEMLNHPAYRTTHRSWMACISQIRGNHHHPHHPKSTLSLEFPLMKDSCLPLLQQWGKVASAILRRIETILLSGRSRTNTYVRLYTHVGFFFVLWMSDSPDRNWETFVNPQRRGKWRERVTMESSIFDSKNHSWMRTRLRMSGADRRKCTPCADRCYRKSLIIGLLIS